MNICVVIQVYKEKIGKNEIASVQQCLTVLNEFDIFFVAPKSLDVSFYEDMFSGHRFSIERFPERYFIRSAKPLVAK